MKSIVLLFGLTLATDALAATAYEALRIVGKQHGEAVLDRVIEVRGKGGAPTPRTWRIVVKDKDARGGVREYDVQGTKLIGDRAPAEGPTGQPLNVNQLNLDSDGAHTVAEREAKKSSYAYDHVDYVLRAGSETGTPVWEVRLVDERDGKSATMNVGADSGKMIASRGLKRSKTPDAIADNGEKPRRASDAGGDAPDADEENLPPVPPERRTADTRRRRDAEAEEYRPREESRRREDENGEVDKPGTKLSRFAERATRHIGGAFQRFGNRVERAVTGGTRQSPPPRAAEPRTTQPRNTYRDANGTQYYRPRD